MDGQSCFDNEYTQYEPAFEIKIGGTTYEVTTHFNDEGRQCVLEQFMDLLRRTNLP